VHAANVEGDVVVDIGIDSAGHVDSAHTRIVASTHRLFSISVREAIDSTRWVPATRQGHPIPSVRRDTFSFVLKDSIAMAKDSVATCPKSTEHHRRLCKWWVSTRKVERVS
jgi:TonB family protein